MVFFMIEGYPEERGLRVGYMRSEDAGLTWLKSNGDRTPIPSWKKTSR